MAPPPAGSTLPPEAVPDRWRLVEALGVNERFWDPYHQNTWKGDRPIGRDWFVSLRFGSSTLTEARSPAGPPAAQPAGAGAPDQVFVSQDLLAGMTASKGSTAFKPPDLTFALAAVVNASRIEPLSSTAGASGAGGVFASLRTAYVDLHLRDVSEAYDFDSLRVGMQPFSTDVRALLLRDDQPGVRLYGTRAGNRLQYSVGGFRKLAADPVSGHNDLRTVGRIDDVVAATIHYLDLPTPGMNVQATLLYNRQREGGGGYDVGYAGVGADGHLGRLNLTFLGYGAVGGRLAAAGETAGDKRIRSALLLAEPSIDVDWIRLRATLLWSSGDGDPSDGVDTGFDAVRERPLLAGAGFSTWMAQGLRWTGASGAATSLKRRAGLLPARRGTGREDAARLVFNGPGLWLGGAAADLDVSPRLRVSAGAGALAFVADPLAGDGRSHRALGLDVWAGSIFRPLHNENVIVRVGGGVLVAGEGLRDLSEAEGGNRRATYHAAAAELILAY